MESDLLAPPTLPPFPAHMVKHIVIDHSARHLYVEPRRKSDPLLMSWIDRCRQQGIFYKIIPSELDEIIDRQEKIASSSKTIDKDEIVDLKNRESALNILTLGASYRASDIHILVNGTYTEIQCRIKGELRILTRLSQEEGHSIIRSFYQGIAVVKDSSFQPLQIQNAQISGPVLHDTDLSSVRIVCGPSYPVEDGGGFMILRLQYRDTTKSRSGSVALNPLPYPRRPSEQLRLGELGYSPAQIEKIRYLIEGSGGIVLFTGPTGSGKTTSIYELLKETARVLPMLRTLSIENPVEYPMPWAVQLSISGNSESNDEGDAFGDYLKHALRMDPDWIFLGEIRSPGVALTAFEASLTGHKVVSTVHTEDPFSIPDRIEIMDITRLPRRMFCNSKMIRGIVNQRLVPQLCPACSVLLRDTDKSSLAPRLYDSLKTYGDISRVRVRGAGCRECFGDGSSRRIAIAEIIITDTDLMRDFIENNADIARRNYRARPDADKSVLATAMDGVLAGRIDPNDIGRYIDVLVPCKRVNE